MVHSKVESSGAEDRQALLDRIDEFPAPVVGAGIGLFAGAVDEGDAGIAGDGGEGGEQGKAIRLHGFSRWGAT